VTFATPVLLALLLPVAVAALWAIRRPRRSPALALAELSPALAAAQPTLRLRLRRLPALFQFLAIVLLVVALARPRQGIASTVIPQEGIDVVVALDTSSSMTERIRGGQTTKLEAAQDVVSDFVESLDGDRVGLVAFQARALTMAPLTLDRVAIDRAVRNLNSGLLPDGTAIGLGLAEALNLLRESPARSRVVVLLTDGQNNSGEVTPAEATALARAFDIRLYTIGFVAGQGSIDAAGLQEMAESTDGQYFDPTTQEELAAAYEEIARLEQSIVGERRFMRYRELGPLLAAGALGLLAVETALRSTWLRRHP
jgi:Ca-activated chloride channel family protein